MFAPGESLPFGDRPVAERPLPAERAGAADRAPPHPGRRPDRARGVRRRSGRLRPRLRAHAGGARPAVLPAGRESTAAAARDARDRGRAPRARASSSDASRCAGARSARSASSPARRPARAVRAAPPGAAHAGGRIRRHAHDRAGGRDDADRRRMRVGSRAASISATRSSGSRQPVRFNLREGSDSDRNATILSDRRARIRQDDARPEARVRGGSCRARGSSTATPRATTASICSTRSRRTSRASTLRPRSRAAWHARSAAGRACAPAPGRGGVVPARPAARRAPSRPGRRRSSARSTRVMRRRSREPTCLEVVQGAARRATRPIAGRQDARGLRALGPHPARLRRPGGQAAAGRHRQVTYLPIRDLPAPHPGTRGVGVLAARARRRADRPPDRDVRDAADGRRARRA